MNIIYILLFFMITTSLTLTGFAVRQRKSNRLLGELVAKGAVIETSDAASTFGVSLQGGVQVIKCSFCAEWVKLEAMVCRFCGRDISEINLKIQDKLRNLDKEREEAQRRMSELRNEQLRLKSENRRRLALKFIKNLKISIPLTLVLIITISTLSLQLINKAKYSNIPEKVSRNITYATEIWEDYLTECRVSKYIVQTAPRPYDETYRLEILLMVDKVEKFDWDSPIAKQIDCFTEKAFAFRISDLAYWDGEVDEVVDDSIDIYTSDFGTPALVIKSSQQ